MSQQQLLEILGDGQYHSGEKLGAALGISRAAVWKQIKKIASLGLSVASSKGKGYCLHGGLSLLNKDIVLSFLSSDCKSKLVQLDVESTIASTNQQAMAFIQSGKGYCYVCTAERQTAGKGRRGRAWVSPYGRNIYLSTTWEFASGASALEGLSLAVGVVVAGVLAEMGLAGVELKWPNDILHDGRKLAGILLEMSGDAAGPCQVVVGIGLNVSMSNAEFDDIDQPWTDLLLALGKSVDRNQLLAALLNKIIPLLASYESDGFAAYREPFNCRDRYRGKSVLVKMADHVVEGKSAGIDQSGALMVDTDSGRKVFNGGEISLRGDDAP